MQDPFELPPDVLRRIPLFAEISKVLSWSGGPVNWDLARQIAVSMAAGESPASPIGPSDHADVAEHVRVAELWLTEAAGMPTPSHLVEARAATPVDWAEHAPAAFGELIDPIAAKASRAMSESPPEAPQEGMLVQALGQLVPMFMGIQTGTILGTLARDVTGSHDTGLPTADDAVLLVLQPIDETAQTYQLERASVRQWVAVRAAAYRLLLEGFPGVRTNFFARYHNYVATLDLDLAQGMERLAQLDLNDPSGLQDALGDEGLFAHQPSPQTAAAAASVTELLALLEAHVDAAVSTVAPRIGDAGRIAEAFARRSLESAAGRRMLASFLGLEENTAHRDPPDFVHALVDARGWQALERMWDDPTAMPTAEELADPARWLARVTP
jgi:putative hydrolase